MDATRSVGWAQIASQRPMHGRQLGRRSMRSTARLRLRVPIAGIGCRRYNEAVVPTTSGSTARPRQHGCSCRSRLLRCIPRFFESLLPHGMMSHFYTPRHRQGGADPSLDDLFDAMGGRRRRRRTTALPSRSSGCPCSKGRCWWSGREPGRLFRVDRAAGDLPAQPVHFLL